MEKGKEITMFDSSECKYSSYEEFEKQKILCRECLVGKTYNCVVCSDGCKKNPIVVVAGEAPGNDELISGSPFVGKAGKKLRATINQLGFNKENTLITNVMPCRPLDNKFPIDRDLVLNCARKWVFQELLLLKPKFLLLLGNQPLNYIAGQTGITSKRGTWISIGSFECMPTYHPSFVIRKMYMEDGKEIEENFINDIKQVAVKAGFVKGE